VFYRLQIYFWIFSLKSQMFVFIFCFCQSCIVRYCCDLANLLTLEYLLSTILVTVSYEINLLFITHSSDYYYFIQLYLFLVVFYAWYLFYIVSHSKVNNVNRLIIFRFLWKNLHLSVFQLEVFRFAFYKFSNFMRVTF